MRRRFGEAGGHVDRPAHAVVGAVDFELRAQVAFSAVQLVQLGLEERHSSVSLRKEHKDGNRILEVGVVEATGHAVLSANNVRISSGAARVLGLKVGDTVEIF